MRLAHGKFAPRGVEGGGSLRGLGQQVPANSLKMGSRSDRNGKTKICMYWRLLHTRGGIVKACFGILNSLLFHPEMMLVGDEWN